MVAMDPRTMKFLNAKAKAMLRVQRTVYGIPPWAWRAYYTVGDFLGITQRAKFERSWGKRCQP